MLGRPELLPPPRNSLPCKWLKLNAQQRRMCTVCACVRAHRRRARPSRRWWWWYRRWCPTTRGSSRPVDRRAYIRRPPRLGAQQTPHVLGRRLRRHWLIQQHVHVHRVLAVATRPRGEPHGHASGANLAQRFVSRLRIAEVPWPVVVDHQMTNVPTRILQRRAEHQLVQPVSRGERRQDHEPTVPGHFLVPMAATVADRLKEPRGRRGVVADVRYQLEQRFGYQLRRQLRGEILRPRMRKARQPRQHLPGQHVAQAASELWVLVL